MTFEATFNLPKSVSARAGVLIGNYDGTVKDQINVEIYNNGRPRLYYKTGAVGYTHLFTTDVRSSEITHLAITIDGLQANLYINGVLKETVTLKKAFATTNVNFGIGSDNRTSGQLYFLGTIYGINMFDRVRTAEEIKVDSVLVPADAEGLMFSHYFK